MSHSTDLSPASEKLATLLAAIAHRAGCIGIFATAAATLVVAMDRPERPALALAFALAWLCGGLGAMLWGWGDLSAYRRRDGRSLTVIAIVLLLIIIGQMTSVRVRHRLLSWGSEVTAWIQTQRGIE